MKQAQVDIENSGVDAREPLLPVAMEAAAAPGAKTTNCCMIACCAPLAIKNGGEPDPKPTPTPAPVHHTAWANVFKANVILTVAAAVWFGGMAMEALENDSLTGEGRRRLMHQHHGENSNRHSHHHHASGECFEGFALSLSLEVHTCFFFKVFAPFLQFPMLSLSFSLSVLSHEAPTARGKYPC